MKKLISVFICAVMVLSLSFSAIAANNTEFYDMGDLNGNEKITAADARLCLRASAKLITLTLRQRLAADIFGTGKITAANARTILRVSAELEKFEEVDGVFFPQPKNPEVLSKEQEEIIKNDWIATWDNKHTEKPEVKLEYFGTYNESVALMIYDNYFLHTQAVWVEVVSEVIFHYGDGNRILIWSNGRFLNLFEAHEQNLLTKEDLKNIKYQREIEFLK